MNLYDQITAGPPCWANGHWPPGELFTIYVSNKERYGWCPTCKIVMRVDAGGNLLLFQARDEKEAFSELQKRWVNEDGNMVQVQSRQIGRVWEIGNPKQVGWMIDGKYQEM